MAFPKFRPGFRRASTENPSNEDAITAAPENDDTPAAAKGDDNAAENDPEKRSLELPTEDAQRGVQHVEAVALTWSKKWLAAVFGK